MSKDVLQSALRLVAKELRTIKFNPYHDSSGRFSSGSGGGSGGPKLAPDTGGGTGGGGGKESYNDRIEGTQKEADREVVRAQKAVVKAKVAVKTAEKRLATHDNTVAKAKKQVKELSVQLKAASEKVAYYKQQKEASTTRIAELKARLAKLGPRKRKDIDFSLKSVRDDLEKELGVLGSLTTLIKELVVKIEGIAKQAEKL